MKTLNGTEKQVKWAEQIRADYLALNIKAKWQEAYKYHVQKVSRKELNPALVQGIDLAAFAIDDSKLDLEKMEEYNAADILGIIEEQSEAKFWIENRAKLTDSRPLFVQFIPEVLRAINPSRDPKKEGGFAHFTAIGGGND